MEAPESPLPAKQIRCFDSPPCHDMSLRSYNYVIVIDHFLTYTCTCMYSATDYKIPKLTFLFIDILMCASAILK